MVKFICGVMVGALLAVAGHVGWTYYQAHQLKGVHYLFEIVKLDVENNLKDARFLGASIKPNATASMDERYEKLYDVSINYERRGEIKTITAHYGISQGLWVAPNSTMFEILDANAQAI